MKMKTMLRSLAAVCSLTMAVTVLPVCEVKAETGNAQENQEGESGQTEITLEDGIYQVPVTIRQAITRQSSDGSYWGDTAMSTGLGQQLDQYVTVKAESGSYTVSLSVWGRRNLRASAGGEGGRIPDEG